MCHSVAIIVIVVVAIKVAQKLLQEDKCDEYVWNLVPPQNMVSDGPAL